MKSRKLKELNVPHEVRQRSGEFVKGSSGKTILEFFLTMVGDGVTIRMAEVLALRQPPGIGVTDTIYLQDQNRHGSSILDRMGGDQRAVKRLQGNLAKHGYKLKSDDHYIPTVARFPGDPEAVVSNTQGLGDLKRNLESRGNETRGMINVEHNNDRPPTKKTRLNPKIVNRIDRRNLSANPDLVKTDVRDRHADIVERHGSPAVKD